MSRWQNWFIVWLMVIIPLVGLHSFMPLLNPQVKD